jgi:uncharacterized protein
VAFICPPLVRDEHQGDVQVAVGVALVGPDSCAPPPARYKARAGGAAGGTGKETCMSTPAPLADVMITLGARDFPALRTFYRKLGWPQIIDDKQFAAFEVHGVVLAVFPITELARDGNTEPDPGSEGIRFTIGIMVDTPEEVDQLTEQMRGGAAGDTTVNLTADIARSVAPGP